MQVVVLIHSTYQESLNDAAARILCPDDIALLVIAEYGLVGYFARFRILDCGEKLIVYCECFPCIGKEVLSLLISLLEMSVPVNPACL